MAADLRAALAGSLMSFSASSALSSTSSGTAPLLKPSALDDCSEYEWALEEGSADEEEPPLPLDGSSRGELSIVLQPPQRSHHTHSQWSERRGGGVARSEGVEATAQRGADSGDKAGGRECGE